MQQAQSQEQDESLKRRFLQEAPGQWEEYVRRTGRLQGKYSFHRAMSLHNTTFLEEYEYKSNDNGKRLTRVYERNEGESGTKEHDEEVFGINPHYAFQLGRKSANSPWAVRQLVDLSKESGPERHVSMFELHARLMAEPVKLDHDLLGEAVGQPTFRVVRCQTIQREGEELVEVLFSYPHEENPRPPYNRAQSGTLVLDPKRFWLVRSCDLKASSGTINKQVKGIVSTSKSLPIPKLVAREELWTFTAEQVAKGLPANNKWANREEYDLDEPVRLPDDEEFTLTAFGLPEPSGVEGKRPTRWYLWVGLAGIGCLVLSAVFAWRKRGRWERPEKPRGSSTMSRMLFAGLLLSGLTLLGLAAFIYFAPRDAASVTIDQPEREFPEAAAGQSVPVTFAVHNPTRQAARIVGLAEC